jgi:GDP-L-fucose synthase
MKILVTGGSGFLGSFVIDNLKKKYSSDIAIYSPRSSEYDLVNKNDVDKLYKNTSPDVVIHLAARVGGIGANESNPGKFFYDNMSMGLHMVEGAREYNVNKFIFVSTVCGYPKFTPAPFKEEDMWNGYPEETNAPYGIAKKAIMVMLQGYHSQYGLNGVVLVPTNLYGPRDHFDPSVSHVIPALIKKFVDAKESGNKNVMVWGDGSATREFLYVDDAARAIVESVDKIDDPDPINLGSNYEISIWDLAKKVGLVVGYDGEIVFEKSKPNGQPRRLLNTDKALNKLGWKASMDFDTGLRNTVEWYLLNRQTN